MGHLTEIANSLQAVAARRPAVARTLCSNAAWTDFAFGPLAERNQVIFPDFACPLQDTAVPRGLLYASARPAALRIHAHCLRSCHWELLQCT